MRCSPRVLLGLLLLPVPIFQSAAIIAPLYFLPPLTHRNAHRPEPKQATCVVDIFQATYALAKAASGIFAATHGCNYAKEVLEHMEDERIKAAHEAEEAANGNKPVPNKLKEVYEEIKRIRNIGSWKAVCTADVTEIMSSIFEAAGFLATAATDCSEKVHISAYCSADVFSLVGSLSVVANSASVMYLQCEGREISEEAAAGIDGARRLASEGTPLLASEGTSLLNELADGARRLASEGKRLLASEGTPLLNEPAKAKPDSNRKSWLSDSDDLYAQDRSLLPAVTEKEKFLWLMKKRADKTVARQQSITNCVLDIGQAMLYLARAGLAITNAVEFCGDLEEEIEAHGQIAKKVCSIDINGIIGSFAYATEFISLIVAHCPVSREFEAPAECSAGISELIGAFASFGAFGSSVSFTCNPHTGKIENWEEFVAPGRRLEFNSSNRSSLFV